MSSIRYSAAVEVATARDTYEIVTQLPVHRAALSSSTDRR
jgi:hypothetical protein